MSFINICSSPTYFYHINSFLKCAWKIEDPEPVVHTHDIVHQAKNISQNIKTVCNGSIFGGVSKSMLTLNEAIIDVKKG
ncbi:hypothetical protein [Acinetobacter sp. SEK541]|uniref:hypothetical protein n=1 Tax=Acinetobacter sp. SEK541 TaxID=3379131 RepID=UPI003A100E1F